MFNFNRAIEFTERAYIGVYIASGKDAVLQKLNLEFENLPKFVYFNNKNIDMKFDLMPSATKTNTFCREKLEKEEEFLKEKAKIVNNASQTSKIS